MLLEKFTLGCERKLFQVYIIDVNAAIDADEHAIGFVGLIDALRS